MHVTRRISLALALVAGAAPAYGEPSCPEMPNLAATHTPEAVATGRSLFAKGLALQKSRKHDEACKMFDSSIVLEPQVGNLLNVAACRERAGKLVEAHELFVLAADFATRTGDRRARFARDRASTLEAKLVRIAVRLADAATPGLALRVAGCPVKAPAAELHVVAMPGSIVVDVSAPERKSFHIEQRGAAGAELAIDVPALGPERDIEIARQAKAAEALAAVERRKAEQLAIERDRAVAGRYDQHPARRRALIGMSIGAAALLTGTAFGIQSQRAQNAFDAAGCGDSLHKLLETTYASCVADADRGARDALLANVFLASGTFVFAVAATVFVLDPGNVERPEAARAAIVVSPRGIGAVVRW